MANEAPREEHSTSNSEEGDRSSVVDSSFVSQELPADIRLKLRKLEKLELKYLGLFRGRYAVGFS